MGTLLLPDALWSLIQAMPALSTPPLEGGSEIP
jgi:hypothetical protein